jgi:hypothetical protein
VAFFPVGVFDRLESPFLGKAVELGGGARNIASGRLGLEIRFE